MAHYGFLSIAVSNSYPCTYLYGTPILPCLGTFWVSLNVNHSSIKSVQFYFTVCSVFFSLFVAITVNFILH